MSKYMTQTNKTILFEEFNSEMIDRRLDFLLRDGDTDQDHKNVESTLKVTSFEEFMDKFKPVYYECMSLQTDSITGESYPLFTYSLNKPTGCKAEAKDIKLQPFYKAMMKIYEDKGASGQNDFDFYFKETLDKLYNPEQAMSDARNIRQSLQYHLSEYNKLEMNGGSIEDQNYHADEINNIKKTIKNEYITQSQFNMLPLLMQDTKERINIKTVGSDDPNGDKLVSIPIKAITFNPKGEPVYHIVRSAIDDSGALEALETRGNVLLLEDKLSDAPDTVIVESSASTETSSNLLARLFDNTAEKGTNHLVVPGNPEQTAFIRDMFLSVFTGQGSETDISIEELKSNLNTYELMYRASQENFAKGVVKLVQKLLNIKAFFDNAGGKAELIVSNCTLETLMNGDCKGKFASFVKTEGENFNSDRLWFAIIPGVWDRSVCKEDGVVQKKGINDDEDDDDIKKEDSSLVDIVQLNTAKRALKLLGSSNIITFFDFKACNMTSSAELTIDKVKQYKSLLDSIDPGSKKYSVFCYPNFTVLPKRNTLVSIGNDTITLPPIFIDSAYIACGLYVASQNMDILKQRGFKVNTSLEQPVRFNFEGKFLTSYGVGEFAPLNHVFASNMNREKVLPLSSELKEEINMEGGFGFCFCGDPMYYNYKGQNIAQSNSYVLRARTLQKDKVLDENGAPTGEERYRPIFKTLIETYIQKISRKLTKSQLKEDCKLWCEGTNKLNINNIVHSGESAGLSKSEQISLEQDKIIMVYDKDGDDFGVDFIEQ